MGETLAETRLEVERQRAELQSTADRLRDRAKRTFDLRAKFRENPALFIGLAAGAVFLAAGGPIRVARLLRRRMRPTTTERAYDSLPKPLQSWVDNLAGTVGPKAEQARETLSEELVRWRHEPLRDKKARKELAKAMVEGPPGAGRTGWKAFEAAAAILSAALARKAVERFLSGEPPIGVHPALDAAGTAGGAAKPDADKAAEDVTRPPEERAAYSSMSEPRG